jgi:uncharacterized heparinase superfamily protein
MPKTAVDKNNDANCFPQEVRSAWQRLMPSPSAQTVDAQQFRESRFSAGISTTVNCAHDSTPRFVSVINSD